MSYRIVRGDVIERVSSLFVNDYFDACLCDPPYLLQFMGKEFDKQHTKMRGANEGQKMQAWHERWTQEVLRVLKPGAHMLAFGGTRTYHRLASAAEDVGFEVRDMLEWLYGSGFPKSANISKGVDRTLGHMREKVKPRSVINHQRQLGNHRPYMDNPDHLTVSDKAASRKAEMWQGYGTCLKPAHEPILLAVKSLSGTYAKNALAYKIAGLNIDESRIEGEPIIYPRGCGGGKNAINRMMGSNRENDAAFRSQKTGEHEGRWPANLILSHHEACNEECHPDCPVRMLDEQSGLRKDGIAVKRNRRGMRKASRDSQVVNTYKDDAEDYGFGGYGSASRFFYCAKVSTRERNLGGIDCRHPTLKPISLTTYLARLLLPPARPKPPRRLLIPFSGAGSEIIGALLAGWDEVWGIEQEPEYIADAEARIAARHELAKPKGQTK